MITGAITEADFLAHQNECQAFLENLLLAAFQKASGTTLSADEATYIRQNNGSVDALIAKVKGATQIVLADTPNENRALAGEAKQTITFYKDFFGQRYTKDPRYEQ